MTGSLLLHYFHFFLIVTIIFRILPQPKSLAGTMKPHDSFLPLPLGQFVYLGWPGQALTSTGTIKHSWPVWPRIQGTICFPKFPFQMLLILYLDCIIVFKINYLQIILGTSVSPKHIFGSVSDRLID